jgi:RNA polymerase sigma factor (sigma-70 family)
MEHPDYVRLVELARSGDMDAFAGLVRGFQDLVMGTAYGWLGEVETARDVSQETFLDAYVNLGQLREPAAFPAWLRRIVQKHCDRVTRRPRRDSVPLEEDLAAADGAMPDIDAVADERLLRIAVASLPAHERMAVSLHYFAGLTAPELAAFLDVPLPAIKKRLHRARRRLQQQGASIMEKTVRQVRPSSTRTFADVVTFFLAIRAGDRARVKHMLERNPDLVNAVQEWDSGLVIDGVLPFASRATALITAIERDDLPLLDMLLDAGADVDGACRCATGESPVWAATVLDRLDHLGALLERGSDPNRPSRSGNMPLHVAAMRGSSQALKLLLAHGADRTARDAGGRTPADWARRNGNEQLARMLAAGRCTFAAASPGTVRQEGSMAAADVLLTGIKALDLFCPVPRGGLVRVPFMAGAGMVVLLGELCRRMLLAPTGRALWTGFSQRPYDFKDWQTEMSELGLADLVQQSLADVDASPEARREAYRRGLDLAETLSASGSDVLLVLISDPDFESDIEESFVRLTATRSAGSITTLHVTTFPERDEATWPRLRPPYAAQIKLHRPRARRGIYPSLDPLESHSSALSEARVGARHLRLARRARETLGRYAGRDPDLVAFEPGGAAADPHYAGREPGRITAAGEEDRVALRLIRYLAQPFFVTEPFSGRPGEWTGQAELLDDVQEILSCRSSDRKPRDD